MSDELKIIYEEAIPSDDNLSFRLVERDGIGVGPHPVLQAKAGGGIYHDQLHPMMRRWAPWILELAAEGAHARLARKSQKTPPKRRGQKEEPAPQVQGEADSQ